MKEEIWKEVLALQRMIQTSAGTEASFSAQSYTIMLAVACACASVCVCVRAGRQPSASFSHSAGIRQGGGIHLFSLWPCAFIRGRRAYASYSKSRLDGRLWFSFLSAPVVRCSRSLLTWSGREDSLFEYIRPAANLWGSETKTGALANRNWACLIMAPTYPTPQVTPAVSKSDFRNVKCWSVTQVGI